MKKELNPAIGRLACPHCGRAATIHRNRRGSRLLYYRCGESERGIHSGCGTVQVYGSSGQAYINKHAEFFEPGGIRVAAPEPAPEPQPEPAPEPAPEPQPEPAPEPDPIRPTKRASAVFGSALARLLNEDDDQ